MQAAHERQRQLAAAAAVENQIRRVLVRWAVGSMRPSFLAWRGEAAASQLARREAQARAQEQAQEAPARRAWHDDAARRARH